MDKFVLVNYEFKEKTGKILVKDGTEIEIIKKYCLVNELEKRKINEKVILEGENKKWKKKEAKKEKLKIC